MIAYVKGEIAELTEENVVIEVSGVGFNVNISGRVAQSLPGVGEQVKLYTYTLVREDAFSLYGFLSRSDLELFKKCISVSGIGPKGALAILSAMDGDSLRYAILSGDAKAISKAQGIGARTAERLILELKDKVAYDDTIIDMEAKGSIGAPQLAEGALKEAVEALTALGYGQTESLRAVKAVPNAEELDSSAILKAALKNLF